MPLTRREFTISSVAAAGLALTSCGRAGASVLQQAGAHHENSTSSGLRYRIFLPPGYDNSAETRYSVLIHLHGATLSWAALRGDIDVVATTTVASAARNVLDPMMIVAPHDDTGWSMWADSDNGSSNIASQIVNELIPEIDATYRTWPVPECRAIQGFSMGGFGAATMLFKHPELFGAGIVWDGAMHDWPSLQTNRPAIASNHFGNNKAAFDHWSPWTTATEPQGLPQPILVIRGALTDLYNQYTSHLQNHGHQPTLIPTSCGHNLQCLTNAAGNEAMAFLAKVTTQTTN